MSDPPRIYLIDGYSNIFRAYYAIRGLSSSKGEPTNAVYGFLQMLRKLVKDHDPKFLGVAFDVSSDTVRKERYKEYKANRKPMPDDLKPQIAWIRKLIAAYKIPLLEMPKYEADDVLGTLAKKAVAAGYEAHAEKKDGAVRFTQIPYSQEIIRRAANVRIELGPAQGRKLAQARRDGCAVDVAPDLVQREIEDVLLAVEQTVRGEVPALRADHLADEIEDAGAREAHVLTVLHAPPRGAQNPTEDRAARTETQVREGALLCRRAGRLLARLQGLDIDQIVLQQVVP